MKKRNTIIYWISTVWLALGMLSTAIVQLIQPDAEGSFMATLGYPVYVATLLGLWKIPGVVVVLLPKLPRLKEWAYAGFFFAMSGAVFSHLMVRQPMEIFPSLLLLVLGLVSWYFRPASRKLSANLQTEDR